MSRLIVLDTETTGLEVSEGHRIIEIGAVELLDRRLTGNNYHQYICPERAVDAGALEVHGISDEFLADKPLFASIASDFLAYIEGADELVIHNAPFDVEFLNAELQACDQTCKVQDICTVTDSLAVARKQYPGKRNSLDALCDRLAINNSHRTLHGALLDSEILADVYLIMTGGQESLELEEDQGIQQSKQAKPSRPAGLTLIETTATGIEQKIHQEWCEKHGIVAW